MVSARQAGSVRDIVSSSGSELDHVVYDSFGNIVTETNASNGDRFKFAGMQYDSTTGQYYDHARNYGSLIGRFTVRIAPVSPLATRTCFATSEMHQATDD